MAGRIALHVCLAAVAGADPGPPPPPPGAGVTYYPGPLDAEGFVDYDAAINGNLPGGASATSDRTVPSPDRNAFVGLLTHLNLEPWDPAHREALALRLGDPLAPAIDTPFEVIEAFAEPRGVSARDAAEQLDRAAGAGAAPWDAASTPEVAAWLDYAGPALGGITAALRRPGYAAPLAAPRPGDPLLHAPLPHVNVLRSVARALLVRGRRHLSVRNVGAAADDLVALRRLAAAAAHGPTLTEGLLALRLRRDADTLLADLAASPDAGWPDRERLRRAAVGPSGVSDPPPLVAGVRTYARALMLDALTAAAREPASLPGALASLGVEDDDRPLWAAAAEVLADPRFDLPGLLGQVNFLFDEMPARGPDEPLADYAARVRRFEELLFGRAPTAGERRRLAGYRPDAAARRSFGPAERAVFKLMTSQTIAGAATALLAGETDRTRAELAEAAEVLWAFRIGRHRWPTSLDELVPAYLPAVPMDPAVGGGAALRYVPGAADGAASAGFVLYSRGPDGEDDGGRDDPAAGDLVFRVGPGTDPPADSDDTLR